MPWFKVLKEICTDAACGVVLGVTPGVFSVSFFTAEEAEEIANLKQLTLSVMEKSPKIVTDSVVCEGIKEHQKSALQAFTSKAPPEVVTTGVITAAELVCNKAFKARFADILMGAYLNLTGY